MWEGIEEYYKSLEEKVKELYEIAREARSKGLDPSTEVEIRKANTLSERLVALFGIEELGDRVNYWLDRVESKVELAFRIISDMIPKSGEPIIKVGGDEEHLAEVALRVGLAIITDATVSAPIEGISKTVIKERNGKRFLSVYYNGPIRTAGGTEGAISVLIADFIRQRLGLSKYEASEIEVERYVEETNLYKRVAHLQYNPDPDEIRIVVRSLPVEVTGPPTEKAEVSSFRNLETVETNRLRGGAILVISDCLIQKAKKLKKVIDEIKEVVEFDDSSWKWLKGKSNEGKSREKRRRGCPVIKPSFKYLKDSVIGRPVLAYPMRPGGFRLRYGRSRHTGLASIGMHPATMVILDGFIAVGTQVRVERPGKSAVVMPVDSIEGPIVRLKGGDVVRIDSFEEALKLADNVETILHLGDVLVGFGEFLENNHRVIPSPWVEEWWYAKLKERADELGEIVSLDPHKITFDEALEVSKKYDIPLHPKWTYFWEDLTVRDVLALRYHIKRGKKTQDGLIVEPSVKEILERLGVPHKVRSDGILISGDDLKALMITLSPDSQFSTEVNTEHGVFSLLNKISQVKIMPKGPFRIGMRVGRPEKAKPRKMKPPVNLLFPVGELKGMSRSMASAYEKGVVEVEVSYRVCPKCGHYTFRYSCPKCGARTQEVMYCPICGRRVNSKCPKHPKAKPVPYKRVKLNIKKELDTALSYLREPADVLKKLKGVKGLTSGSKSAELIEKGILRAKHDLYVFKDGTIRFDAVNAVLTQFKPAEVGVSVEKLRELGYTKDTYGNELLNDEQLVDLMPQDIIIPRKAASYLIKVAKFIDDLLLKVYGQKPFYRVRSEEDLIGHIVLTISPHTFVANVARIVGFTDADVLFAHPYLHAAKRRNVDGDEDSIILALDALLNFSKEFLPSTPGGREDAPLIMVTKINTEYIDDEVYNMEIINSYPSSFYEKTYEFPDPKEISSIVPTVGSSISAGDPFPKISFSIPTSKIDLGPLETTYRKLNTMDEKKRAHFNLEGKIRAVDKEDALARAISSHFLRDIVGNLRKFGQQVFRCLSCNAKYRRPPLTGKCLKCGGDLTLTVHKGTALKYMEPTMKVLRDYGIKGYLSQRIELLFEEAESLFLGIKDVSKVREFKLEYDLFEESMSDEGLIIQGETNGPDRERKPRKESDLLEFL